MDVTFKKLQPWAILPTKTEVDPSAAKERRDVYEAGFRWLRANRAAELCRPWRMAQELGWVVRSPLDVSFDALEDTEFEATAEELGEIRRESDLSDLWRRERSFLATRRNLWLRIHQYQGETGWETVFTPNGEGSVEWYMGWKVVIPDGMFLIVLPHPDLDGVDVPSGILDKKTLDRMHGMSIAAVPRKNCRVARGQAIARVVLLDKASITARARYE